ncbi:hypothetical protein MRB53_002672 [Persea americana]|uniref:Uncharacterized protein n=1 Tax=Persea americana TaxID=3435 RepID=A0ACC2MWR6_PERAE|nr:hypothetical protein MRB53_002672 [Persea americana]
MEIKAHPEERSSATERQRRRIKDSASDCVHGRRKEWRERVREMEMGKGQSRWREKLRLDERSFAEERSVSPERIDHTVTVARARDVFLISLCAHHGSIARSPGLRRCSLHRHHGTLTPRLDFYQGPATTIFVSVLDIAVDISQILMDHDYSFFTHDCTDDKEGMPGVGKVVQRIPNYIYATIITLGVVLLQNSGEVE